MGQRQSTERNARSNHSVAVRKEAIETGKSGNNNNTGGRRTLLRRNRSKAPVNESGDELYSSTTPKMSNLAGGRKTVEFSSPSEWIVETQPTSSEAILSPIAAAAAETTQLPREAEISPMMQDPSNAADKENANPNKENEEEAEERKPLTFLFPHHQDFSDIAFGGEAADATTQKREDQLSPREKMCSLGGLPLEDEEEKQIVPSVATTAPTLQPQP